MLSGEAGAGKTQAGGGSCRVSRPTAGVAVAWATCWSDGSAPLSTWLDLQSTVNKPGTPSARTIRLTRRRSQKRPAVHARSGFVADMRTAIGSRPTLMVVDDLQWCDPLSLHAIEVLVGALRTSPIGLVATFREDGDPSVARLDALARGWPPSGRATANRGRAGRAGRRGDGRRAAIDGGRAPSGTAALAMSCSHGSCSLARSPRRSMTPPSRAVLSVRVPSTCSPVVSRSCRRSVSRCLLAASVIGRRFRVDVLVRGARHGRRRGPRSRRRGASGGARAQLHDRLVGVLASADGRGVLQRAPGSPTGCVSIATSVRRWSVSAIEGLAIPSADLAHHFANAAAAGVPPRRSQYADGRRPRRAWTSSPTRTPRGTSAVRSPRSSCAPSTTQSAPTCSSSSATRSGGG